MIAGALAVAALALAGPARAQSDPRAELTQLYRLTISNDLCDFPLTETQSDLLARRQEELETTLDLSEDASQALYDQVERQMQKQKAAGLCDPKGEWAKAYAQDIADLK
jgi:hypothetical protein